LNNLPQLLYRTEEEKQQIEQYGFTYSVIEVKNADCKCLKIPAQNWLTPPLFETLFKENVVRLLECETKDIITLQGVINITDTLTYPINGVIHYLRESDTPAVNVYYELKEDGIYLHISDKQAFITEFGNCCVSLKTMIIYIEGTLKGKEVKNGC
jgi:hypothetical protein